MFFRQLHMKLEDFEKKDKTRVLSYFVRVFKYLPNEVHFYLCYVLPKLFRRFCNHFPEGCRRLYLCHQMILRSEFHLDLSQFLFTLFDLWVLILWERHLLKEMLLLVQPKSFRSFLLLWIWKTERSSARRNNHITDFVVSFVAPLVHFFKKIHRWCCELKDRTNAHLLLYRFVCRWLLSFWICLRFFFHDFSVLNSLIIFPVCVLILWDYYYFLLVLHNFKIFPIAIGCIRNFQNVWWM